jgi:putative DNA primase/helicase
MFEAKTQQDRANQIERVADMLIRPEQDKPPISHIRNVEIVLTMDPFYRYRVRWNDFTATLWFERRPMRDKDLTAIRLQLYTTYNLKTSTRDLAEVVQLVAEKNPIHPVREYLTALKWDGTPRIDGVLATYAGAEDTEITRRILGRRWMISAVARIMRPGCKVDTVLILAGPQGYGKSTFFKTLAGAEWFRDDALDIRNKDAAMQIRGAWLYELAELASTRTRDSDSVKAFMSRSTDSYRPPYAVTEPRQSVFCGTTNEPSFLNDSTGSRRFWPVHVVRIPDLKMVERDRDQLWAEAFEALMGGERWWLELNEDRALQDHQERYQSRDPWYDLVAEWVDRHPKQVTVDALLDFAIEVPKDRRNKSHQMRIGGILTALGYEKRRRMRSGIRRVEWVKS